MPDIEEGREIGFRLERPVAHKDILRLVRMAERMGIALTQEMDLQEPALLTVAETLTAIARERPIVTPGSFFGREHTALYLERLGIPWGGTAKNSLRFGSFVVPPSTPVRGQSHLPLRYRDQSWEEFFPEGHIVVLRRREAGLDPLPHRVEGSNSYEINLAMQASSVVTLSQHPEVMENLSFSCQKKLKSPPLNLSSIIHSKASRFFV